MTNQSLALGSPQALETSVQVALRIRPINTDAKNPARARQRPETEVLSLIERSYTPTAGSNSSHDQPQQVVVVPLQRHFTFDHIFGTGSSQEEVYQGSVKRMVDKFMEGYNVTIMAYGQTSSGKTYTMGTGAPSSESRGHPSEGIIPRAMSQLFQEAKRPPPHYPGFKVPALKTTFKVSFVEIYNEDLIDLLVKGDFRPPVTIREDTKGNIFWTGVQEIVVSSVEEVIHLLWFGSQNRQTHSTEMNEKSSRSHAIFSITLRQEKFVPTHPPPPMTPSESQNSPAFRRAHAKIPSIGGANDLATITAATASFSSSTTTTAMTTVTPGSTPSSIPAPFTSGIVAPGSKIKRQSTMVAPAVQDDPEPEGEWIALSSKFHFVDLAGSERLKRTSAIGDRAKEGISINAGLHALGNVISALGDPSKKASHVPYRDSKLTRLLQDSLGGNALALMIACVSPSEVNLGETLNTLKYANRARNIKNSSSLNQEINMDNPEYLRTIIQKLKMEIKVLKESHAAAVSSSGAMAIRTSTSSPVPTENAAKAILSNRHSISTNASASTAVQGDGTGEDHEDGFTSPSRRLSHYQSRDSISTDISHSYLDAVQEEDDRYSETSSRTVGRTNIPSLMLPSLDSKSFQDFVEPVIEEYEKVISGLETHLAMTQAALNHSEQMLEEQQGSAAEGQIQKKARQELEATLKKVQGQLKEAEVRRVESERYVLELEEKLSREQAAVQERFQAILGEKELTLLQSRKLNMRSNAKDEELKQLSEKIHSLETQYRRQQEEVEAEAESLRAAQAAREATAAQTNAQETEQDKEEREANERREDELIEMLQSKAALQQELEAERARHEVLISELEATKASQQKADLELSLTTSESLEKTVHDLGLADPSALQAAEAAAAESREQVKELARQLTEAKETEQHQKNEMASLLAQLERLQKEHDAAMEMEEMLHLAVSDLESRLQISVDADEKHKAELEEKLAKIQDLETRSTQAEKEAIEAIEGLKAKLAEAKVAADERLADELLELLEKMEKERTKVEELQIMVENQLAELTVAKTRAADLEADRDSIQDQWNADKERIEVLEKDLEMKSADVVEKAALIASLGERVQAHEGTLVAKAVLEQELEQRVVEHEQALAAKVLVIQELEAKVLNLETLVDGSKHGHAELMSKVQAELATSTEQLTVSQARVQEQEQVLANLTQKLETLESVATLAKETQAGLAAEHAKAIEVLESKVKVAEANCDEAETRLEEVERRHQLVDSEIKDLRATVAAHLLTIESLQTKTAEATSPSSPASSRPVSLTSTVVGLGDETLLTLQKLEKEKARYRALVRENEREIERLSQDLESLANEFSNAATAFEDAEEEMKARITELESMLEDKNLLKPSNSSQVSLASSLASSLAARHREGGSSVSKAQLAALKTERDQALQSSEELSLIVAELNEKNHSLQERLLNLEREQESIKLQHVLERQAQQEELRALKDRTERLDRASPVSGAPGSEDDRTTSVHERILRHKSSMSSETFSPRGGEDSLATPRQSWSTASSQPTSQIRAGRHESTLIQQAKHIKQLEERLAEYQNSGSGASNGVYEFEGPKGNGLRRASASSSAIGLGIHHKGSDSDLTRSSSSPLMTRPSIERMSPALRALATFTSPPTPPPSAPLPPPPIMASVKNAAHLNGNAPPSPRTGGSAITLESASPGASPLMRPSRTGSVSKMGRRERDSSSSSISDTAHPNTSATNISAATAQALHGVEAAELRGVVDTLAHQVQALKVEQAMQQGKISRLEAALAETEEKLRTSRGDRDMILAERETLMRDLERVRAELTTAQLKNEKDRAGLEGILERERREREKAVETRAIMEARMEELMGKKSKFACF